MKGIVKIMCSNIENKEIGIIEKCVGEFQVWIPQLLPCKKCKIKIYEGENGRLCGCANVRIIMKYDNSPEGAVGWGKTITEVLTDAIKELLSKIKEEYPEGLKMKNIEYSDNSDF